MLSIVRLCNHSWRAWAEFGDDPEVWVVLISGGGEKAKSCIYDKFGDFLGSAYSVNPLLGQRSSLK